MFTDDNHNIFMGIDDVSLMANALLDITPVFTQNDVFLWFHSEPFADWTTAEDVNIESSFSSGWNDLSSSEKSLGWNIVGELARDLAWNILSVLSDGTEWRILGSSEIESAYHIIVDQVEETIWNILTSSDIESIWNILNAGTLDAITEWLILTDSGSVELNWNTIALDTLDSQWNLLNEISSGSSWNDISAAEFTAFWNIVSLYFMDVQIIWNILSGCNKDIEWRVKTTLRRGLLWLLRSESTASRYILDELVAVVKDFEFIGDRCYFEIDADDAGYVIEADSVDALRNEADAVEFEFKAMPKGGWS